MQNHGSALYIAEVEGNLIELQKVTREWHVLI